MTFTSARTVGHVTAMIAGVIVALTAALRKEQKLGNAGEGRKAKSKKKEDRFFKDAKDRLRVSLFYISESFQ